MTIDHSTRPTTGYGDLLREVRALGLLDRRPWFYAGVFSVLVLTGAAVLIGVVAQAGWLAMSGVLRAVVGRDAALPEGFWGDLLQTQARGVLLTVLPIGALVVTSRYRYRLQLKRTIAPARVVAGTTARVRLELANVTKLSTRVLLAEDRVPYALGPSPRFVLARLPGGRRAAEVAAALAMVAMFLLLAWLGGRLVWDEYRFEVTSPGLGAPQWIYTLALPLFSLAIVGRALGHLIRTLRAPPP